MLVIDQILEERDRRNFFADAKRIAKLHLTLGVKFVTLIFTKISLVALIKYFI